MLPSLGAIAIIVREGALQHGHAVAEQTALRARALMTTIDLELAKSESGLQVLAASSRVALQDLTSFQEQLRAAPRPDIVSGYRLVDRDGREWLNSQGPRDPAPSASRAAALQSVLGSGKATVTRLDGPDDPRPSLVLGVPMRRGGDVVLALAADLALEPLASLLAQRAVPDDWRAALVDEAGSVVVRSPGADRTAADDLLARVAGVADGPFSGVDHEGRPVVASRARSSLSPMTVVVVAPRSSAAASLSGSLAWLVGLGALVLAFVLWFALRLARHVSRSVEGLIEPALALGSGRAVDRPPTSLKEADAVGRAIEKAAGMLADVKHQANHDALTGLCNRTLFDEIASHQLAVARRAGQRLAVLAIDLDGFKAVNDRYGHAAGDAVLRVAADRIHRTIRSSDVVSRRGGDEFSVLLGNVGQLLTRQIGQKLVAALAEPYPDVATPVSASVGIALFPESGATLDELLEAADEALYTAKKAGKRRVSGDA